MGIISGVQYCNVTKNVVHLNLDNVSKAYLKSYPKNQIPVYLGLELVLGLY